MFISPPALPSILTASGPRFPKAVTAAKRVPLRAGIYSWWWWWWWGVGGGSDYEDYDMIVVTMVGCFKSFHLWWKKVQIAAVWKYVRSNTVSAFNLDGMLPFPALVGQESCMYWDVENPANRGTDYQWVLSDGTLIVAYSNPYITGV